MKNKTKVNASGIETVNQNSTNLPDTQITTKLSFSKNYGKTERTTLGARNS